MDFPWIDFIGAVAAIVITAVVTGIIANNS